MDARVSLLRQVLENSHTPMPIPFSKLKLPFINLRFQNVNLGIRVEVHAPLCFQCHKLASVVVEVLFIQSLVDYDNLLWFFSLTIRGLIFDLHVKSIGSDLELKFVPLCVELAINDPSLVKYTGLSYFLVVSLGFFVQNKFKKMHVVFIF